MNTAPPATEAELLLALQTLRGWFKKDLTPIGELSSAELALPGCPNHLRADLKRADKLIATHFQET